MAVRESDHYGWRSDHYGWRYRCSICGELIQADRVKDHTEKERAKPSWPGLLSWTRVDGPFASLKPDG